MRTSSDPFAPPPPEPSNPMHIPPLTRPPSWLMKPCGARFAFGGKLLSFDSSSTAVSIVQISTEPEILARSEKLEMALQENNLQQFCTEKASTASTEDDKQIWSFIRVLDMYNKYYLH